MGFESEADFLALVDEHFDRAHPHMELGRGDDCSLIRCPRRMVVTSDLFLEHAHFRRDYFDGQEIGRKALAVNISDIHAMGARPLGFSLQLFGDLREADFWDAVLRGMAGLAREHDLALTGGDLSSARAAGLAVTVWGEPFSEGRVLQRGLGRPGDLLVLAGRVGLARTGLSMLEERGREAAGEYPEAVTAHLTPALHPEAARELARCEAVRGAMDLSDGLASDLPRFLASGTGARLELPSQEAHPEVRSFAEAGGLEPWLVEYLGGEDYALLAAVAPDGAQSLARNMKDAGEASFRVIGTVTDEPDIRVNDQQAPGRGFDHFVGPGPESGERS